MKTAFSAVLPLLLLAACTGTPGSSDRQSAPASTFTQQEITRQSGNCVSETEDCFTITLAYPQAGDGAFGSAFNAYVAGFVRSALAMDPETRSDLPFDSLIDQNFRAYEAYVHDMGGDAQGWSIEVDGEVIYTSPSTISVSLSQYSYLGGAHPNGFVHLASMDAITGQTLAWTDLVRDTLALLPLAEAAFRAERELAPGDDLAEAGFWFPESGFALPANYALTDEGLLVIYNPYEVAPYVMGPTSFVVARSELGDLLLRQ
ncbi:MAG: DUF3298 and DUF4163 domain-containing protein [Bacteroidia bacterium]